MTRVCVIFGGESSEHEVSLRSATCVLENIDKEKYEVVLLGITKNGNWYHYTGPIHLIESGKWETSPYTEPAIISPDKRDGGIMLLGEKPVASTRFRRSLYVDINPVAEKVDNNVRIIPIDIVFPVLHGKNGENGTIQGLLDLAGIPYVGCGVLSSAACMDKEFMHIILKDAGVTKTDLVAIKQTSDKLKDIDALWAELEETLGSTMFVKPANAGSSVGISKIEEKSQLKAAINKAFEHDHKIVIERAMVGREIECAVWGNDMPHPSHALGEIIPQRDFYDYEGKYLDDTTTLVAPAEVDETVADNLRQMAVTAYKAMDCAGLARVDFFIEEGGRVVLNEINTLPGFTSISMFPRLFQEDGLSITELIDNLISSAFNLGNLDEYKLFF